MDITLGEIRLFPYNKIPSADGWMPCSGQILQVSSNQALFSLLGNYYGGNYPQTFALPNLNGRTGLGTGQNPMSGSTYTIGDNGGSETVTLTANNIPPHNHYFSASGSYNSFFPTDYIGNPNNPVGATRTNNGTVNMYDDSIMNGNTTLPQNAITNTGGGQAHENRMPYLAMIYCIATKGYYPQRP